MKSIQTETDLLMKEITMSQQELEMKKKKMIEEIKKVSKEEILSSINKAPEKITLWKKIKILLGYGKER